MFALVGVGASVAYALLAPEWFEARLAVVPSQRSANPAMGLIASLPGAEALGVASATDVQRIQAVLTSNSVADEVIAKFKLDARYGTSHVEQTRQALSEHCTTLVDRKSGVVALTCEDREPEVAMQMAAFFGDVGNRCVFGRISCVVGTRRRWRFLEGPGRQSATRRRRRLCTEAARVSGAAQDRRPARAEQGDDLVLLRLCRRRRVAYNLSEAPPPRGAG